MTLKQDFENALRAAGGPQTVLAQSAPRSVRCVLSEVTSLAVNVDALVLDTAELAAAAIDELEDMSNRLSARVNYLLEPIGPVEIDADACTVQLRSMPPQKDDDGRNYYELLVRRGGRAFSPPLPQGAGPTPHDHPRHAHARGPRAAGGRLLRGAGRGALRSVFCLQQPF